MKRKSSSARLATTHELERLAAYIRILFEVTAAALPVRRDFFTSDNPDGTPRVGSWNGEVYYGAHPEGKPAPGEGQYGDTIMFRPIVCTPMQAGHTSFDGWEAYTHSVVGPTRDEPEYMDEFLLAVSSTRGIAMKAVELVLLAPAHARVDADEEQAALHAEKVWADEYKKKSATKTATNRPA